MENNDNFDKTLSKLPNQELIDHLRNDFNLFIEEYLNSDVLLARKLVVEKVNMYICDLENKYKNSGDFIHAIINYYIGTLYSTLATMYEAYKVGKKIEDNKKNPTKASDDLLHFSTGEVIRDKKKSFDFYLKANKYFCISSDLMSLIEYKDQEYNSIEKHLQINMSNVIVELCPILAIITLEEIDSDNIDLYNDYHLTISYQHAVEKFNAFRNNGMDSQYIKELDNKANVKFNDTLRKFYLCYKHFTDKNLSLSDIKTMYEKEFILQYQQIINQPLPEKLHAFETMIEYVSGSPIVMSPYVKLYNNSLDILIRFLKGYDLQMNPCMSLVLNEFDFIADELEHGVVDGYYGNYLLAACFNLFDKIAFSLFKYVESMTDDLVLKESEYDFSHLCTNGIKELEKISEPNFRMVIIYLKIITLFNNETFTKKLDDIRTLRNEITHKPISNIENSYQIELENSLKILLKYVGIFLMLAVTAIDVNNKTS